MGVKISGIGVEFGSRHISSEEVAARTGSPADFRRNKLGIGTIRVAAPGESTSDLAARAVRNLFDQHAHLRPEDVEFLILVTQNPDHKLPTTACILQHKAGLPKGILAYDLNQGCSGYLVALAQAKALIASGVARKGLLVTSELYNNVIDTSDRNTFGIFGDAAAATFLETGVDEEGVGDFFFGCDGSANEAIIVRTGGTAMPARTGGAEDWLHMDGKAVLKFVLKTLPNHIRSFLDRQALRVSDVDHWIFHQANRHMNSELCMALDIPPERAFFDIEDCGNTVSSSVPIAMQRAFAAGAVRGRRIMLCGFGVGLSWAGCLYRLRDQNGF